MHKLIFDSADLLLKTQIQQCLAAIERVGFIPPEIEYLESMESMGTISTKVHLGSGSKKVVATFDSVEIDVEHDVGLYYQCEPELQHSPKNDIISIAIPDGDVLKDSIVLSSGLNAELNSLSIDWTRESSLRHYSWFILALSLDFTLEDAAILANAAVKQNQNVSRETWPMDDCAFSELSQTCEASLFSPFKRIPNNMGLYPVVDSVEWVEVLLKRGIRTLQLRMKDSSSHDIENQVMRAVELGKHYNAQLFINDYWQLAVKFKAYGVHLGQDDIETADLQAIYKAGLRVGISTHGYYEILRAKQLKASYIALGHIFPTTTKQMPSQPQGLTKLALYQRLIGRDFPSVAIGGIDLKNAQQVWQTGVSSLAVVRAITQADDIQLAIDSFYQIMASPREQQAIA